MCVCVELARKGNICFLGNSRLSTFHFVCPGMKHQHFRIPVVRRQSAWIPVAAAQPGSAGRSLGTQCQGHQASRPGAKGCQLARLPGEASRESLMKSACCFWQGNRSVISKQVITMGFFFLYFNLKFCFKQGESNILSFSVGHMVKSKSERPKKCTGCEAEDPAYIHKRSRSIFCSSKTKLFQSCGLSAGECGKAAHSSYQDKSFKIGKQEVKSFNYSLFFLLEHNWGFNFIGFIAEHSNTLQLFNAHGCGGEGYEMLYVSMESAWANSASCSQFWWSRDQIAEPIEAERANVMGLAKLYRWLQSRACMSLFL